MDKALGCFLKLIAWAIYGIVAVLICGFLISTFFPKSSTSNTSTATSISSACRNEVLVWNENTVDSTGKMSTALTQAGELKLDFLSAKEVVISAKRQFNSINVPTCFEYALMSELAGHLNNGYAFAILALDSSAKGNIAETEFYSNLGTAEMNTVANLAKRLAEKIKNYP